MTSVIKRGAFILLLIACASFIALNAATARAFTARSTLYAPLPTPTAHTTPLVIRQPQQDPPGDGGIITSIIKYFINATVYFPAKTFELAVREATTKIFIAQFNAMRGPLEQVLNVYGFSGSAIWGDRNVDIGSVGQILTDVAVPIWMLSLSLIALGVLVRNATGSGYGMAELAQEAMRWFFIALASGNGITIVNLAHKGFNGLALAIVQGPQATTAGEFVRTFLMDEGVALRMPVFVLVAGSIIGFVVVLIMCVTYIARITLLFAVSGLAPLAIAAEGIPFARFVFRDWLAMFLRLELLTVLNAVVLRLYGALNFRVSGMVGGQDISVYLLFAMEIGLACVMIGLNISVFNQVFGLAIEVAGKMVGVVTTAAGLIAAAATGGAAAPIIGGASASAGSGVAASTAGAGASSSLLNTATAVGELGRAANLPLLTPATNGFARGVVAGEQMNARATNANRLAQQQRELELKRARTLAREVGATSSGDIDTIANSIISPPSGTTSEEMTRAYRETGPAMADASRRMGGPAQAAAIATEGQAKSFGEWAAGVATERARMNRSTDWAADKRMAREPAAEDVASQPNDDPVTVDNRVRASETLAVSTAPSSAAPAVSTSNPPEISNLAGAAATSTKSSSASTMRVSPIAPSPSTNTVTQAPVQALIDNPPSSWPGSPTQNASAADQWTLHDWGMGMGIAFHANADPTHAPLWGETFSDLRRASLSDGYGEPYVRSLLDWVQTERVSERQLMDRIDRDLSQTGAKADVKVRRFWKS